MKQILGLLVVVWVFSVSVVQGEPAKTGQAHDSQAASAATKAEFETAQEDGERLIEHVIAAPDYVSRRAVVLEELDRSDLDADMSGRLGIALVVLGHLNRTNRTDPSIIRLFLRASLADDPAVRGQAVEAASAGGDPPVAVSNVEPSVRSVPVSESSTVAPNQPSARSPELAARLRDYKQRHLVRGKLNVTSVGTSTIGKTTSVTVSSINTWGVYDGGGAPFATRDFATTIGDEAMIARLNDEKAAVKQGAILMGGAGVIATVAGAALGLGDRVSQRDESFVPVVVGGLATGLGISALSVAPLLPRLVRERRFQWVMKYYSVEEADVAIEAFNAKLRAELGLSEGDVLDIDLKQSRRFRLEMHPWVGVASIGLAGRF